MQLSHLFEDISDHALSKDVDVSIWQDFRAHHNMKPLKDSGDFVIVNNLMHDEFDKFKKEEIQRQYSYLRLNHLLEFYLHINDHLKDSVVMLYNNAYLKVRGDTVDDICKWIYNMRKSFQQIGLKVFQIGKRQ